MQVIIHAGAHKTDDDKLVKCLMGNEPILSELGTAVPHPNSYRKPLRDLLNEGLQTGLPADTRARVLEKMRVPEGTERLILSNHGFFGTPRMAVNSGQFYPAAVARLRLFQEIFHLDDVELFLALRDPGGLLPALAHEARAHSVSEYIGGGEPRDILWSDMLSRISREVPDLPVTVWCNEDTPLIWGEVLREMAGVEPTLRLDGEFFLLHEIMSGAGMKRFLAYVDQHPDMSEVQRRRVIVAFLDKFAKEEALDEELDLPGWTDSMIEDLSVIYDEDCEAIGHIPGVTMITP
ncbi:hypothetical protein [Roseovarius sp.]|uniref:hypothetical protein n=1 Tax=Roseovarius sp. TaxID=1486281 RepID=UPI000C5A8F33|nr:hypothetical protein [Roseovarius sp.]MAO25943.1 hypothetical protein [Roseovarius sp.]MAZ21332.1 hypothetical protein [Roseovarius sp.]